ncbi:MAG: PHP domain-containing protein [Chlamydiales bacterium]|nr:PHP domain-containing protein [Chlamydiales bacterium]
MTFRADLHCHSTFSDGTDTPEALIRLAVEAGLSGLSITDHDTLAAYPAAIVCARQHNLRLLPGVEFSASHQGNPIHILAYAFSVEAEALKSLCERHRCRRLDRNRKILEKLRGLGIAVHENELGAEGATIGRPHIANVMLKKGIVSSIKEAFDRYLGEGKRAYDPGDSLSVIETLDAIHAARGVAVIAHPHLIKRRRLIRYILELPFDGIEAYYARFSPQLEREWIQIGIEKKWIITGGSDYHGGNKPFNLLGSSWVGEETFDRLYAHYLASNS